MATIVATDWLCSVLNALAVPPSLYKPLVRDVERWVACSGEEWTVAHLKELATGFLQFISGDQEVYLPKEAWIRKDHRGVPRGHLGALYRWGETHPEKAYAALTIYTHFTRKGEPTVKQVRKFLDGVHRSEVALPADLRKKIRHGAKRIRHEFKPRLGPRRTLVNRPLSPHKRHPILTAGGKTITVSEADGALFEEFRLLCDTYQGQLFMCKHEQLIAPVLPQPLLDHWACMVKHQDQSRPTPCYAGAIGFIQEPGYKLRAVANPLRIYQEALGPLGRGLYSLLEQIPWDCTFEQKKGFPVIQEHLRAGRRAHSIDLSSATDLFPLLLQEDALRALFPRMHVDLFVDISRLPWFSKVGDVRWTKGQPLGLYPSFGAFALTHGILLWALADFSYDNQFYVLGDDVIILSDDLALKYRNALKELDCDISQSKSITSANVAEFGGWVITPNKSFQKVKWRRLSDNNVIRYCETVGPRILPVVPYSLRREILYLAPLPRELGGLGWNPDGIPLEQRLLPHQHWLYEPDEGKEVLTSLRSKVSSLFTKSSFFLKSGHPEMEAELAAFDLKAEREVRRVFGNALVPLTKVLGKNLGVVSRERDVLLPYVQQDTPVPGKTGTPIGVWRSRRMRAHGQQS